jgi:hypothetical protein
MACKECLCNKRCSKDTEVKHYDIVQLPIAGEPKYRCGNIQCAREVKKEFIYCPYCGGLLKR